jgi:hypothetical protein
VKLSHERATAQRSYFLHASRRSDGSLLLETTSGEMVHEDLCGPGSHCAKLYSTTRLGASKRGRGIVVVPCDSFGRINERA